MQVKFIDILLFDFVYLFVSMNSSSLTANSVSGDIFILGYWRSLGIRNGTFQDLSFQTTGLTHILMELTEINLKKIDIMSMYDQIQAGCYYVCGKH